MSNGYLISPRTVQTLVFALFALYQASSARKHVSLPLIKGPNGQQCNYKPQQTNQCPVEYNTLTSNGGYTSLKATNIKCEDDYSCCTCSSIYCGGIDGNYCEGFLANGVSSALHVHPISIIGDPADGADIHCKGESSCEGTQIEGQHINDIQCSADRSCADTQWTIHCHEDDGCIMECEGEESCQGSFTIYNSLGLKCEDDACKGGEFILDSDIENSIECDGQRACYQSEITANGLDLIECTDTASCAQSVIMVTDPVEGFELKCQGHRSCHRLAFVLKLTESSTISSIEGFTCDSGEACRDATILIVNESPNTVTVGSLNCDGHRACFDATITVREQPGAVVFEECKCGQKDGCVGTQQSGLSTPIECIPFDGKTKKSKKKKKKKKKN
eukprot:483_1